MPVLLRGFNCISINSSLFFLNRAAEGDANTAMGSIMKRLIFLLIAAIALPSANELLLAQKADPLSKASRRAKTLGVQSYFDNLRSVLMDGNSVVVRVYDNGQVAPGLALIRHVDNFVWNGLGDLYVAGPVGGAEVTGHDGKTYHILSDAINDSYAMDRNPMNDQLIFGWRPLAGYINPSSKQMATNTDPTTWAPSWKAWPGLRGTGSLLAAKEAFSVMDDSTNSEFPYYAFSDSLSRGLGIRVENRFFQFDDPEMTDVLFAHYTYKNVSGKPLKKMIAGFYLDVDVGGGSPIDGNEGKDDLGFFDRALNLAYFWDANGIGNYGRPTHYDAVVLLETPGNSSDGIDNDGDGLIDESQNDGIDNDKDWDVSRDDVGADGIAGTHDYGEGDGVPTLGEPNFEMLDREESDEIGLTSFRAFQWTTIALYDDEPCWSIISNGFADTTMPQMTDIVSLFGSAYYSLAPGETTHYTAAFMAAWDLEGIIILTQKIADQYTGRFYSGPNGNPSLAMALVSPVSGQKISGTMDITWTSSGIAAQRLVDIWYSNTYEPNWKLIAKDLPNTGSYSWNTTTLHDGVFYRLRVVGKEYGNQGFSSTPGTMIVDNPGNSAPEVVLTNQFLDSSVVHDTVWLSWVGGDPEGATVSTTIDVSCDGGMSFESVLTISGQQSYPLDTRQFANTRNARIRLTMSDGVLQTSCLTRPFAIQNSYRPILPSKVAHVSGNASGTVVPLVVDSTKLTGHRYRVSFDSLGTAFTYSVRDLTTNELRVDHDSLSFSIESGRLFDGLRLAITGNRLLIDEEQSGFVNAPSTHFIAKTDSASVGVARVAPFDVNIVFNAMDTNASGAYLHPGNLFPSSNGSAPKCVCPFTVSYFEDTTTIQAVIVEKFSAPKSKNGRWDPGEEIAILTPPPFRISSNNTSMGIRFDIDSVFGSPNIYGGEVYIARMKKPFSKRDVYEFTGDKQGMGAPSTKDELPYTFKLEQNFPNPFNPATSIRFSLAQSCHVSLTVYDMLGRVVEKIIDEPMAAGRYTARWDGTNVATGMYFYRIAAGNFVEVHRMLLLK